MVLARDAAPMRITVTVDHLRSALSLARQVIPARPRLVALGGVLLHVRGTALRAIGSDGDSTLAVDAGAGTGARDGQVLLPPKPLADYLSNLPAGTSVTLELDDDLGDLTVRADGRPAYRFRPLQATFQLPPSLRSAPVSVDWSRLGDALAAVDKAVGDDSAVQLVSDDDTLTLNATDLYRLGRASLHGAGFGRFTGVVDVQVLKIAARCGVEDVTLSSDGKQLRMSGSGVVLTTRVMSVMFPAVETVFSQVPDVCTTLSRDDVAGRLGALAAVAGDEHVRCDFDGALLTMSASNRSIGEAAETVEVPDVAAAFSFGAKPQYLQQALSGQTSDTVEISWSNPVAPVYLASRDGGLEIVAVVMPVRLP